MKKSAGLRNPSASSLRELPELDLSAYRARKNPYAARIARDGIELVHTEPSAESLREIPPLDFSALTPRRNRYASRAAESMSRMQYGRGRPPRGAEVGPTAARSIRLPASIWLALEEEARLGKTTVHALLRKAIAIFLERKLLR